jgi:ribA/ribD-fused uncharacterized protein
MKLCWLCYIKKQVQNNLPDGWDSIPNVEVKEKCEVCGINGIYVREVPQPTRRIDLGKEKTPMEKSDDILQFQGEYRWLSNFWDCHVEYDGRVFASVEHGYHYSKCETQEDKDKMYTKNSPQLSRRFSKKIKVRSDWDDVKLEIMEDLVRQKFNDPTLRKKLLDTGKRHLQEGNRWGDKFWGTTLKGEGENHLGKILMKIRDELRKENNDGYSKLS